MTDEVRNENDSSGEMAGEPCDVHLPRVLAESESAAAPEPFPIVEFSQVETDATGASATSPWNWGVMVYGTNSTSPTHPLRPGDVVTLEETVGEPVQLLVRGEVVAEGVLVRENKRVGLRILRVVGSQQSPKGFARK